ncbi:MAG: phytanoyl-CoA dioxygenase family protein [Actinomycetes bacterium]
MSLQGASKACESLPRTHFLDEAVNQEIAERGFAVLANSVSSEAVAALTEMYRQVIEQVGRDSSGVFLPSMMISRLDLRARLWDGVQGILGPIFDPLFAPETTTVVGGSFVSKPGSQNSARNPHQDPSVFDETREVSISLWIPLTDSHSTNGTLCLLPGSHRMGNHVRPPDVDSLDQEVSAYALNESIALDLNAGQVLVIDGSVIHHSPSNTSDFERVAAICALRPPQSKMLYAQSQNGATEGIAQIYNVGAELYRSGNLVTPTLDPARLVQSSPYRAANMADLQASLTASSHV